MEHLKKRVSLFCSVAGAVLSIGLLSAIALCQSLPGAACPMDSTEYQVISDFINAEVGSTYYVIKLRPSDCTFKIARFLTPYVETLLKRETVESYISRNSAECSFERKFQLDSEYTLIDSDSYHSLLGDSLFPDWEAFYSQYPGSGGCITISRPGVNLMQSEAILSYFISSGFLRGSGGTVVLRKIEGQWVYERMLEYLVE